MTLNKAIQRSCCFCSKSTSSQATSSTHQKTKAKPNRLYNCFGSCMQLTLLKTRSNATRHDLNYFLRFKLKTWLLSLATILIYYILSISLTFYNRMLFVTYKYPLSITVIHLIIKFFISMLLRHFFYCCTSQSRVLLKWDLYYKRIIPTSIASVIDIGLSNWSLQYITVTLYTMSKSTVILFILIFSLVFKLEKWVGIIFYEGF
jgi:hypothetical protein